MLIKCPECKYTTRDKWYYNQYKRVHNATLPFSCHYCGKGSVSINKRKDMRRSAWQPVDLMNIDVEHCEERT